MKRFIAYIAMTSVLTGCIGASVLVPKSNPRQVEHAREPQEGHKWCGISLWLVFFPVPLMLPVCKIDTELTSDFYSCGPLMHFAKLGAHYKGNALCGRMPAGWPSD